MASTAIAEIVLYFETVKDMGKVNTGAYLRVLTLNVLAFFWGFQKFAETGARFVVRDGVDALRTSWNESGVYT